MKAKIVSALLLGAFAIAVSAGVINERGNAEEATVRTEQVQTVSEEPAGKSVRESNLVSSSGVIAAVEEQRQNSLEQSGAAAYIEAETIQTEAVQTETGEAQPQIAVATVLNYVNIRSNPTTESEVLGKLYNHSVGTVLAEENGWYLMQSGSVTGYVKAEYVLTGAEGQALADQVGQRLATVNTTTLKVRTEATTESKVLGLVPGGDTLAVAEEWEGWVKVAVEAGEGYVSTDYVDVYTKNVEAESKEEEEARLAQEEAERKAAEEAARKAEEERQAKQTAANSKKKSTSAGTNTNKSSSSNSNKPASQSQSAAGSSNTSLGQQIANYGLQFVGNPYVYGGTSLTNGADCSGFVQSVYKNFGISLPRTSGEQGRSGSAVGDLSAAQPGDLIWYSGHIGIYIGNGQIVHASTTKTGIIVSNANYRTILSIRRIV